MLELDDNYYMDLHTMMAHRSQPPSSLLDFLRTVEETDEIGVYDCDGVRVVVPIDMVTNKTSCDVNEDMVVVYSAQDVWIFCLENTQTFGKDADGSVQERESLTEEFKEI